MADPRPRLTDRDLERALRAVADEIAYPPTPDLAATVRGRIAAAPAPRRRRWTAPTARRFAFVAVLLLILLGAVLGALAPVREGIARRLGLENIAIVQVTAVPTPTPPPTAPPTPTAAPTTTATAASTATGPAATPTPFPTPTVPPLRAQIGTPTTLAAARAQSPFPIRTPSAPELAAPDEVYADPTTGGRVSLLYAARPGLPAIPGTDVGLLLQEFRGGIASGIFQKGVPATSRVEPVAVDGVQGYWIEGGLRALAYTDASGNGRYEETRYAGNTLIWEKNGVVYRLESSLPKDDAVRIASTFR